MTAFYAGFEAAVSDRTRECSECYTKIPVGVECFRSTFRTRGGWRTKWCCSRACVETFEFEYFAARADARERGEL